MAIVAGRVIEINSGLAFLPLHHHEPRESGWKAMNQTVRSRGEEAAIIRHNSRNLNGPLQSRSLFLKGIVPAEIWEAGEVTIGGTDGQPVLNSQRRQMSIGHEVRARQCIAQ